MSLATSTSAKALQRSSADKCVYLYDGSLLIGYWNGTAGQVAQVTSPLTSPSVTNLFTTAEDGISLWADNSSGTSSYIWVASSYDDASGAGPGIHLRSGTYTSGGGFSWNTSTSVPGTTQADTISCSVTWNGTYLIVFMWDGVSGTDRLSYAYTADKTGQTGWTGEKTLNGGTWSTIVQVAARHSVNLGATVIAYGGNSRMFYGALADGVLGQTTGATASETGTWSSGTTAVGARGIIAVSPSGSAPVLSCGDPKQVRATSGSVTGTWGNGQPRTAGNLLVAVVSATGTTSAAAVAPPSGWTRQVSAGAATLATCAILTATAAGADAAPTFTSAISGTATMTCTLFELANANTTTPVDTSGAASTASSTITTQTATTSGNLSSAGDYLITGFVRERTAATATWTAGSGWWNVANDGTTSSTGHCAVDVKGVGPELNNWAGNGSTGFYSFADNYTNFGGPQLVVDEATGDVHCARAMTTGGGPTNSGICYWHGTYSSGTVSWSSVLVLDADGGAATPADIGAAVDGSSRLYVTYTDAATSGNLKYATLVSPFTSVSTGPTVIVAGSGTANMRWPHSPPVSASMGGLGTALPVLYTNTFSSPYPVNLDTSVTLPGGAVSGAATLSGSGSLTSAGLVTQPAAAALAGSGALTATRLVTQPASGALAGSGSLTAAGQKTVPAAAALSGSGALTAVRALALAPAAALSGSGSVTAQAAVTFASAAVLAGSGSLGAQAAVTFAAAAVLSGSGVLTAPRSVRFPGASALSGTGTLGAARTLAFAPVAALSGLGSLSVQGLVTQPAAAALSGSGSLGVTRAVTWQQAASLSGTGTLTAQGIVTQPAAAALAGSGALTAAPAVQFTSACALSGSGGMTAAGLVKFAGTVTLSGSGALTAAALVTQPASAALSGTGSVSAAATLQLAVSAALAGSGTLSAAALVTQPASASLVGSGSVTAAAAVQFSSGAALSGTGSLTAAAAVSGLATGSASLSGAGALAAAVTVQFASAAALSGSGALAASVAAILQQAAALSGTGTVTAAALVTAPASAALNGSGLLGTAASVTVTASAALSGLGTVAAAVLVTAPSGALLSGTGAMTAGPSLVIAASVSLAGLGTITALIQVIAPVTEPAVTWHAQPAPARWHAGPGVPRWLARPVSSRWHAAGAPPRWTLTAASCRWRIIMTSFSPIAAVSLEEVNVTWTSGLAGTSVDPTGQTGGEAALPVQMAFPVSSGNPAEPSQPGTWFTASWLLAATSIGYVAQTLVGPGGGVVTLTAGLSYDVWSKVTGSPEVPAKFAGTLPVY